MFHPLVADTYLVGISPDVMAHMVVELDTPFPPRSVISDGFVWGVVEVGSTLVSMYVDNAEELVWIGTEKYQSLQRSCKERNVSVSCIRQALAYEEATID